MKDHLPGSSFDHFDLILVKNKKFRNVKFKYSKDNLCTYFLVTPLIFV